MRDNQLFIPFPTLIIGLTLLLAYGFTSRGRAGDNMPYYRVDKFTSREGLSHNVVNGILQDRRGLMWFATEDGLNKFDGINFQIFRPNPIDTNQIHESFINYFQQDSKGRIWISYVNGYLDSYDPNTGRFSLLRKEEGSPGNIQNLKLGQKKYTSNQYQSLLELDNGNVIIASRLGLYVYDGSTTVKDIRKLYPKVDLSAGITTLYRDTRGLIWIGTESGLSWLNLDNGAYGQINLDLSQEVDLASSMITQIYEDSDHNLWVGTSALGAFKIKMDESFKPLEFQHIKMNISEADQNIFKFLEDDNSGIWITSSSGVFRYNLELSEIDFKAPELKYCDDIIKDRSNIIWIASRNSGLHRISKEGDAYNTHHFHTDSYDIGVLSSNSIDQLYLDDMDNLWIATIKGGINKIDLKQKKFFVHRTDGTHPGLDIRDCHAIYEDKQDKVLLVGGSKGVSVLDYATKKWSRFEGIGLQDKFVSAINQDNEGNYWFGFLDHKVSKYNKRTGKLTNYEHEPENPHSFEGWSLREIYVDSKDNIWFGTVSDDGLICLPKNSNRFVNYKVSSISSLGPAGNNIFSILENQDGMIYIGTSNGLSRYNLDDGKFEHFRHDIHDQNSVASNFIICLYEDSHGQLWVGTSNGLSRFDHDSGHFTTINTTNGLPNNTINAILEDDTSHLWVSTNLGISRINLQTMHIENYTVEDGLQGNEFNKHAAFKSELTGNLYFGGTNGITHFNPRTIEQNKIPPGIALSQIAINGKILSFQDTLKSGFIFNKHVHVLDEIILNHDETSIQIELSAIHYASPNQNLVQFKIDELDDQWHAAIGRNKAIYTSLKPGDYTFRARAANNDGIWSTEDRVLKIIVLAPIWLQPEFIVLSILSILILTAAIVMWRVKAITAQKRLLEQQVTERTEELADRNEQLLQNQEKIMAQKQLLESKTDALNLQNRKILLLQKLGQRITSNVRFDDLFKEIYHSINEFMKIDHLMLGQVNEQGTEIEYWGLKSKNDEFDRSKISLDATDRMSVFVYKRNEGLMMNNMSNEVANYLERPNEKYFSVDNPQSGIYIILRNAENRPFGILAAQNHEKDSFNKEHLDFLRNLAAYISIGIDNSTAYRKIKTQSDKLQKLDKQKSQFYAEISHEFRTPLTLINNPIQDLIRSGDFSKTQRSLLGMIQQNSNRLLRLVSQIMDLNKLESKALKLQISPNDVVGIIRSITDSFIWSAQEKSITYNFYADKKEYVGYFDIDKIEKIVYNLIQNAVKFTPRGGKIDIDLKIIDKMSEPYLELTVADNGIGIKEKDLNKIFHRYYRCSTGDVAIEGTGIGLALVKHMVELHKGEVSVRSIHESEGNKSGTTFIITVPISKETYATHEVHNESSTSHISQQETSEPQNLESNVSIPVSDDTYCLLIVEDNAELRNYIGSSLQSDFHVLLAENGIEGKKLAEDNLPDLIITDVMMPLMNGYNMTKDLRENPNTNHIPIIMLTAKDDVDFHRQGLESGVNDYITKPFDLDLLKLKINNILDSRKRFVELYKSDLKVNMDHVVSSTSDKEFFKQAIKILEDNVSNVDLDVNLFCKKMAISRTVLYQKMRDSTGLSINDFIKHYRLKFAAKLMSENSVPVSDVAILVGFNDPKYFSKCFKKFFGKNPKEYMLS